MQINMYANVLCSHSMGCVVLFVAASYHPEIASKIKLMIAYAPAVFISHAKTLVLTVAPKILPMVQLYWL